jgi:hypothetical protein
MTVAATPAARNTNVNLMLYPLKQDRLLPSKTYDFNQARILTV